MEVLRLRLSGETWEGFEQRVSRAAESVMREERAISPQQKSPSPGLFRGSALPSRLSPHPLTPGDPCGGCRKLAAAPDQGSGKAGIRSPRAPGARWRQLLHQPLT